MNQEAHVLKTWEDVTALAIFERGRLSMSFDYDVIIAGAGIAGLITAASAAHHSKQKLRILVVDRNSRSEAGKKTGSGWVCGDAVSKNSVDYLASNLGVRYDKPELEKNVHGVLAYSPDHSSKVMFDGEGYVLNRKLLPQRSLASNFFLKPTPTP
jgi:flavin-dependent dehydrogenase